MIKPSEENTAQHQNIMQFCSGKGCSYSEDDLLRFRLKKSVNKIEESSFWGYMLCYCKKKAIPIFR